MDYKFIQIDKIGKTIMIRFKLINGELADVLKEIFNTGIEDGSMRKEIEIDITINQFLYSYRAILSRAFSDNYPFVKLKKTTYINHFLILFTQSLINNK